MHKVVDRKIVHYQQCHKCDKYVLKTKDRYCYLCHRKEFQELLNLPKPRHRSNDSKEFEKKTSFADIEYYDL